MSSSSKDVRLSSQIRGAVYCVSWCLSILLGFMFLYAPLLPLLFMHRPLYRRLTDVLFVTWETFNTSLVQFLLGVDLYVSGDAITSDETSLVLINHRTRLDWNFVWAALFHAGVPNAAHNAKLVLKDDVKSIPGVGWTMQMSRFLYISRKWKEDEVRLGSMVDLLAKTESPFQILLFPEGTNFTAETKARSDTFAEKSNLANYNHVLHPRTTGFSFLAQRMTEQKKLDAIYDITIAYPDQVPEDEKALMEGKIPTKINFLIRRFGAQDIPTTIIGLEKWLQELWREKEQFLTSFLEDKTEFPVSNGKQAEKRRALPLQYMTLVSWYSFLYYAVFHLVFSISGFLWILLIGGLMFAASKHTNGIQELEASLEKFGNFKGIMNMFKKPKQE